jgi:acetoacetyl-CoA synthetase
VPDEIVCAPGIPYTISGKKMETPVKKILMGKPLEKAVKADSLKNPESLAFYIEWGKAWRERMPKG